MEKIGVVVTVYNKGQFVGQCLDSILYQSYGEIEVVVVDDGSTDSGGAVCDRVASADCRVKVIHQPNQGPIAARLNGVREITADYVTFVDGDDWISRGLYDKISSLDILGKVDIIAYGITRYHSDRDMRREESIFEGGIYNAGEIESRIMPRLLWDIDRNSYGLDPSLCTKIFRRKRLEEYLCRIDGLNLHYGEDIAVLYPLFLECQSVAVISGCYYYHRIRKNDEVAPYIEDVLYYDKLYSLYKYLKGCFSGSRYSGQLTRQLDYFYMYSVRLGKLKYGDIAFEELYLFPFDRIRKGSRVVLYGAGQVGQTFYRQLQKVDYCVVSGWVDRDYYIYDNSLVREAGQIGDMEYDYILVAINSADACLKVQRDLERAGVEASKIIRYK